MIRHAFRVFNDGAIVFPSYGSAGDIPPGSMARRYHSRFEIRCDGIRVFPAYDTVGGAAPPPTGQESRYAVLLPLTDPGPAPRLGALSSQGDRDFQALAYLATLDPYLNDVEEFIAEVEEGGDEYADLNASDFDADEELIQRGPRQWRKPRRQ